MEKNGGHTLVCIFKVSTILFHVLIGPAADREMAPLDQVWGVLYLPERVDDAGLELVHAGRQGTEHLNKIISLKLIDCG